MIGLLMLMVCYFLAPSMSELIGDVFNLRTKYQSLITFIVRAFIVFLLFVDIYNSINGVSGFERTID